MILKELFENEFDNKEHASVKDEIAYLKNKHKSIHKEINYFTRQWNNIYKSYAKAYTDRTNIPVDDDIKAWGCSPENDGFFSDNDVAILNTKVATLRKIGLKLTKDLNNISKRLPV